MTAHDFLIGNSNLINNDHNSTLLQHGPTFTDDSESAMKNLRIMDI